MRKDVVRESVLLVIFLSDWANIHKTARARTLSRVRGGCITVRFTVKSAAATLSAVAKRRNQENRQML
jgi:hypothetical protein